jgi:hypothetical protein
MADGRIICVFYAGLGHVTTTSQRKGGGAIAYTISQDEGNTWSEPQILLDTPMDDRDPSISLLRDGRLMLTYFRLVTVPDLAGDGVYVATVRQGPTLATTGKSVGLITDIPRKLQHDAGTSSPMRDFGNGLLMLGSYHIDQPYVIRSEDNGKTWQVFAIPNGGKHLDAETDIIQLKDKRFYAVLRGRNCNGHYGTSSDGKNWTVAEDIGFPLHCPQLHRVELGLPAIDGSLPGRPEGATGLDESSAPNSAILLAHRVPATAMHYSLDECKTWIGPVQIDSCGGAYPCFVTCRDGTGLVVYYTEGTDSEIRCRRFRISSKGVEFCGRH